MRNFTGEAYGGTPSGRRAYLEPMRLTHLGHACLLVETGGQRILIDPGSYSRFEELGDLDAIVVTHQHPDHVDADRLRNLLKANPQAALHVEPSVPDSALKGRRSASRCEPMTSRKPIPLGDVTLEPVGDRHAVINEALPRIGNLGVVVRSPGEPTLFHPGDAYDAEPGPVDVLAVPINAPWAASKETTAFVQRIGPRVAVPIHDALLSEVGRGAYIGQLKRFGPEGLKVRDLGDRKPVDLS